MADVEDDKAHFHCKREVPHGGYPDVHASQQLWKEEEELKVEKGRTLFFY